MDDEGKVTLEQSSIGCVPMPAVFARSRAAPKTDVRRKTFNRESPVPRRRKYHGIWSSRRQIFGLHVGGQGFTHFARTPMYRTFLLSAVLLLSVTSAEAESGLASYYGGRGHGMTCAHRTRPFGSIVTVRHEGRSIQCRVNDRGPFVRGRVIDLSVSAARALGMMQAGIIRVSVE